MKRKICLLIVSLVFFSLFRFFNPVYAQTVGNGSLEVRSIPPDAYVLIDGVNVGSTTYKKKNMSPGTYRITVKKSGKTQEHEVKISPNILTIIKFRFTKESRIGYFVDDSQMLKNEGTSPYTPIDPEFPTGVVDYIPVESEDFINLKMSGCQRKYNLDAFLLLTVAQKTRTSDRDIQVTINSNLYDFDRKKTIFEKRFVRGKEFNRNPEPPDIDDMRLDAFGEFLEDFNKFMKTEAFRMKGRGGYAKPVIQYIAARNDVKVNLPQNDSENPPKWVDKEYKDGMLRDIVGKTAFPFTLKTRLNKIVNSSDYIGKQVIVLYFFDASFAFCKKNLDDLALKHSENEGEFLPIGIVVSGKGSRRRVAENFLRARLYNFPVVFDTGSVSTRYGVNDAVPLYVVIDTKGKIRYIKRGTADLTELYERIRFLNSKK